MSCIFFEEIQHFIFSVGAVNKLLESKLEV